MITKHIIYTGYVDNYVKPVDNFARDHVFPNLDYEWLVFLQKYAEVEGKCSFLPYFHIKVERFLYQR